MIQYIPKTKEWFMERIGKKIYRDTQGEKHCCDTCKSTVEKGMFIYDEMHADYLACTDVDFAAEGIYSNYRDEK